MFCTNNYTISARTLEVPFVANRGRFCLFVVCDKSEENPEEPHKINDLRTFAKTCESYIILLQRIMNMAQLCGRRAAFFLEKYFYFFCRKVLTIGNTYGNM